MNNKKILFVVSFLAACGFLFSLSAPKAQATTIAEIQALIQQLQQQIADLQKQLTQMQPTTPVWCHDFNTNLRYGDEGDEVYALQLALEKERVFPPEGGIARGETQIPNFGEYTASAVVIFQEKYKSEILTPLGLARGTGVVASATRAKLNKLYGCVITPTPIPMPIPTPTPTPTTCRNYWWYDNTTRYCYQKQVCGEDAYAGVPGYNTLEECNASLKQTSTTTPSITILSPNGGEQWIAGKAYTIKWQSNNIQEVSILIRTYEGMGINELALRVPNTGSYIWNISQNSSGKFLIYLQGYVTTGKESPDAWDYSDNYFSIVAAATGCTETDSGKDYYTKGITQVGDSSFEDTCHYSNITKNSDGLSEYFCDSTTYGKWNHITVKCSGGCVNGACLGTAISPTCSDPDGTDIYKKGSANNEYGAGQGDCCVADSWGGVCVNESNYVKEGLCKSGAAVGEWTFTEQTYKCPNGCKDGACISASTVAIPSITVLSPNGGEQWVLGSAYTIKWSVPTVNRLVIDIINKNGSIADASGHGGPLPNGFVVASPPGSYLWTIPSTIVPGDYKARISECPDNNSAENCILLSQYLSNYECGDHRCGYDTSDNYFSVVSGSTSLKDAEDHLADISKAVSSLREEINKLLGR